jgi:putative transposase
MAEHRRELSDEQWARLEPLLPGKPSDPGRSGGDNRLFVRAVQGQARCAIADRAYDSDGPIAGLERRGVEVVIPPRSTPPQRPVPWLLYWLRNVVERAFCRLKLFRRVATRYDKTAASYSAVVHLAAAVFWI